MNAPVDGPGFVPDLEPGEARIVPWTAEQYHSDRRAISRSMLCDLIEETDGSPALFHAKHVARTMQDHRTRDLDTGTYVHLCLLEPEEWARRIYWPKPKKVGSGKEAARAWKLSMGVWEACKRPDAIPLKPEERARIESIAASVRSHRFARMLLESPGQNEQTVLWRVPATFLELAWQVSVERAPLVNGVEYPSLDDVLVRVRIDRLVDLAVDTEVVFDLKTARDPSPRGFKASIIKFGYHLQAGMYCDAVKAASPDKDVHFVVAAVRKEAPLSVPGVYAIEGPELELGRNRYRAALVELIRRRAENDWLADWQKECQSIALPAWAYRTGT